MHPNVNKQRVKTHAAVQIRTNKNAADEFVCGELARLSGFEPKAYRLGNENRAFLLYPSNARKRLLLLHF